MERRYIMLFIIIIIMAKSDFEGKTVRSQSRFSSRQFSAAPPSANGSSIAKEIRFLRRGRCDAHRRLRLVARSDQ